MTTYALIPGAGGAGVWYWSRVVDELSARGHRGVAIDLPAADGTADFEAYIDVCIEHLGDVEGADLVVVAQSLGAFTGPPLAQRVEAREVVFLNGMIPHPRETPGHWFATAGAGDARRRLAHEQGRTLGDDIDVLEDFFHDVPDDVVAESMAGPAPEQSESIMGCATPFDTWPSVPHRVIVGRDDRFFPADFQAALARDRLSLDVEFVPGGHLAALAHPVPFVERLLR